MDIAALPPELVLASAGAQPYSLFQDVAEIVKSAALVLAILIPFLGALFAYKREMNKTSSPNIGGAGLVAIGGALANKEETERFILSQDAMTQAIDRLQKTEAEHVNVMRRVCEVLEQALAEQRRYRQVHENIEEILRKKGSIP
jgi:hypothetical protein